MFEAKKNENDEPKIGFSGMPPKSFTQPNGNAQNSTIPFFCFESNYDASSLAGFLKAEFAVAVRIARSASIAERNAMNEIKAKGFVKSYEGHSTSSTFLFSDYASMESCRTAFENFRRGFAMQALIDETRQSSQLSDVVGLLSENLKKHVAAAMLKTAMELDNPLNDEPMFAKPKIKL